MKRGVAAPSVDLCALFLFFLAFLSGDAMAQANVVGQWSTLPYLMPINPVHEALMYNGKVLIVSGSGNDDTNTDFEAAVWDPQAGTIATQALTWDMFCSGMAALPDGRLIIDGGTLQYNPFLGLPNASVFDPVTSTFSDIPNMAHGRWYPTVTALGDGRVMAFSGLDENDATNLAVEFYTEGVGWSQEYIAPFTPPLYPRMHLLPNGTVFNSGWQPTSNLFDPSTQTWTLNVATTNFGVDRTYGTAILLPLTPINGYDAKVMIMGGGVPTTSTTEIIDLNVSPLAWQYGPDMSQRRMQMNAVILPSRKVLALGGSYKNEDARTASLNADLYDPVANTFSSAGANAYARLYHSNALLLPDATVWVSGGNPTPGTFEPHMEIYQPAYLFTTDGSGNVILATRPTISSSPTSITWGSPFTVQTPDASDITSVVLVRNGTPTHSFDMDQRLVTMSFTVGSSLLTVTPPPNGNVAPPGYYMLFILNSSGVPSVANFVQMTQPTADFAISAAPSNAVVKRGSSTRYKVTISAENGFSNTVSLSVTGLPALTRAAFNPPSITGSGSSNLTISTAPNASPGTYTLTITGSSGTLSHSAAVRLRIQ